MVGYRGTFAFGRDGGIADVKFRKLWRILVAGRVSLCREVFRDSLNESRDVDRGDGGRYTSRFFLKHAYLEQAFDALLEVGVLEEEPRSRAADMGQIIPDRTSSRSNWPRLNQTGPN